jgi:hypothetical protein
LPASGHARALKDSGVAAPLSRVPAHDSCFRAATGSIQSGLQPRGCETPGAGARIPRVCVPAALYLFSARPKHRAEKP